MVTKQLNEYLNTNNLLNKHQYGFQFYKSTSHALLHAIDFIFKAFSNNELVLLVFLDLRKAFDLCPNLMNLSRVSNPPKNLFQLSVGLNLEKLNTILSEITIFEPRLKFKPQLKFFKFGLRQ